MLVEELEAFIEITSAFEKLGNTHLDHVNKLSKYRKQQEQIISSDKKSYGFFNKVSKDESIRILDQKIAKLDGITASEKKLIVLISLIIHGNEIEIIKNRKRARFEEILREFAITRLKKLEKETEFWGRLLENDEGYDYTSEALHNYLHNKKTVGPSEQENSKEDK